MKTATLATLAATFLLAAQPTSNAQGMSREAAKAECTALYRTELRQAAADVGAKISACMKQKMGKKR